MKNFYLFFFLGLWLFGFISCNKTPEPISKANENIENGKYEKAISILNKIDEDEMDEEWLDSANVLKNTAFELLLRTNDWDRITVLIEDEGGNKKFKREMSSIVLSTANEFISKGYIDTMIAIYVKQEPFLLSNLDSTKIVQIPSKIIDSVLPTNWVGKWDVLNYAIMFKKGEEGYEGYCTQNSGSGWYKDKVMYKTKQYVKNLTWRTEARIFQGGYEYFNQVGTIKIHSADSIYIWYGASGLDATFVTKKTEEPKDSITKK
jgi:hypothetical protein